MPNAQTFFISALCSRFEEYYNFNNWKQMQKSNFGEIQQLVMCTLITMLRLTIIPFCQLCFVLDSIGSRKTQLATS